MKILYVDKNFQLKSNGASNRSRIIFNTLRDNFNTDLLLIDCDSQTISQYYDLGDYFVYNLNSTNKRSLFKPKNLKLFSISSLEKFVDLVRKCKYDNVFFRFNIYPELMDALKEKLPWVNVYVDVDLMFSNLSISLFKDYPSFKNRYHLLEAFKLKMYERKYFKKSFTSFFSNQNEMQELRSQKNFSYLPNSYDFIHTAHVEDRSGIIFYGDLDSSVNKDAFKNLVFNIYPYLKDFLVSSGEFIYVVGPGDLNFYKHLITTLKLTNIKIIGEVDCIQDFIIKASCVLLPVNNFSGTLTRVIETALLNTPLVTTDIVASSFFCKDLLKYASAGKEIASLVKQILIDSSSYDTSDVFLYFQKNYSSIKVKEILTTEITTSYKSPSLQGAQ